MPPNAPNCVSSNTEIYCAAYSASSNHSGGVNCGFVDGSIHFVSETVDTNGLPDSKQGNKLMGTSSYGVWDAMGTPSGGESKFVL
ncbi:MAG: DUF1559 domain-containing protein [Planctomycetaceae bacterium]|nr:DUF1559 domain-containing protein [Planctomycetaceae bacterium]